MAMLLAQAPKTDRVGRYPKHVFQTREVPYTAQPIVLAPVLPGESLKNLFFESRVVTDPIKNPLIGWKKEYYFFYVKITDLLHDAIRDMFIDPENVDLTATLGVGANNRDFYTAKGAIDYTARCMKAVVEHYFRDEGEAWDNRVTGGGIPFVQVKDTMFLDSLTDSIDLPEGDDITEATTAGDLDRLMDAFEMLRALGMSNMTYEDYLRTNGIAIPNKDENKPEMLARFTDFQYPSNTINPTNGTPTSAVSWVFKNGSRDPKFFKEPGFILGLSVTRPKLYYRGLAGSMAGFMGRAWDWMPNYLSAMPETSLKMFGPDTGPLGDRTSATDAYWLDMRDLLLYGDQFQNVAAFDGGVPGDGAFHLVGMPGGDSPNFDFKYVDENTMKLLFIDDTKYFVKQDGYCSLSIVGAQRDHTIGNIAQL